MKKLYTEEELGKLNLKELKRWIEALKSRDYRQCRYSLREPVEKWGYEYCSLGVLCDINKPLLEDDPEFEWDQCYLPASVYEALGFEDGDPVLFQTADGTPITAVEANDSYGMDFGGIARCLESIARLAQNVQKSN